MTTVTIGYKVLISLKIKSTLFITASHKFTSELSALCLFVAWSVHRASLLPGHSLCEWWVQNLHGHNCVSPERESRMSQYLWKQHSYLEYWSASTVYLNSGRPWLYGLPLQSDLVASRSEASPVLDYPGMLKLEKSKVHVIHAELNTIKYTLSRKIHV